MKKLILFLIMGMFMINLVSAMSINIYKIEQIKIKLDNQKDYYSSILDFEKIESIAQDVANSHEYELHIYDCTDFSRELIKRLKIEGYKAQCTSGNYWLSNYTNHTWVSVWIDNERFEIESTNGNFISKEDYKNYEVNWENYCW